MRKAVYHGIRDVRVEQVEEPSPAPGQAKIKVKYCGICGSDLHEYLHGKFPVSSFGHEVCGEIVELGHGLKGLEVGDRVAAFNKDGYAEYLVAPEDRILKLPEGMNWERAAVVEPLAGAAYAVGRAAVKPGDTIFIAGAGPVGLLILTAVRALGVSTVYMTDLSETRRKMAEKLGATAVFDPSGLKVPAKIRELTHGRGADVTIEAVGIEASLKDCLASTRTQGTVLVQGIFTERVPVHMLGFVTKEMTMIGANSIDPVVALEWLQTKDIHPESIITRIIPLEDISARGFEVLTTDKDKDIKVLVELS
jgi:(R,R)-butanediol dehydrogenase/meso-butanediol dehydrogenase/diacetyl reductase